WCQAGGIRQGATVDQGMIVSLFPVNAIWVNSYYFSTFGRWLSGEDSTVIATRQAEDIFPARAGRSGPTQQH
ncbi:hypothetical protein OE564_23170, partial [Aeromonas hydrophila]|uniref:hypothetical protein n=1 Tax=Aeromonas hydrophila TaxID=644 RepID=UPI0021F4FA2E